MSVYKLTNSFANNPHCQSASLPLDRTDSLLKLLVDLQKQKNIDSLVESLNDYLNEHYQICGLSYIHPLIGINIHYGSRCAHTHTYKLRVNEKNWGCLTCHTTEELESHDKKEIDAICGLLVQTIVIAANQTTKLSQPSDDFEMCLENPLLTEKLIIREAKLAHKEHLPMSMLLINIDHFRKVNQIHGSSAGDHLLYELMEKLLDNIQSTDFLFRYKFDTFCLILRGLKGQHAYTIGERLRKVTKDHLFYKNNKEKGIRVTLSCGIAELDKSDSFDTLFARANNALRHAKKMGRNTTIVADGRFLSHKV